MYKLMSLLIAALLTFATPTLAQKAEECRADQKGKMIFLEPSMDAEDLGKKYPTIVRAKDQTPYEGRDGCSENDVFVFREVYGFFKTEADATAVYHAYTTLWSLGQSAAAGHAAIAVAAIEEARMKAHARLRK